MNSEVYSHGHHPSVTQAHAARTLADSGTYLIPHLRPGLKVLDVGCGPGSITADLARTVAPGTVTGLDRSPDVIAEATQLHADLPTVRFQTGNVYDLDFPDETFDLVHAHQVLHHLADPVAALREMRRVARPGGLVAVRDADYSAMSWHPRLPELDEWMELYQRIARGNGAEPDAGRRLPGWAQDAGFEDIEISSSNWLYATPERRLWHAQSWSERVLHSAFADQALERGLADQAAPERISAGWLAWAQPPDGTFLIPSTEIIARS